MTVTEFSGDLIFDAAARHWPEREFGWQWRLGDLLDAVRDQIEEDFMADRADDGGSDDDLEDVLADLRMAIYEVDSAASSLRRFVRDKKLATP